ncbi:MAG: creatininase family protein [Gemmatimonadales bacterium]
MRKAWSVLMTMVLIAGLAAPAAAQQRSTNLSPEERARRLQEELRAPRPIEALNSVWIEELTWMEVRDALAAGKTTAIIPTGGIEQNGPYAATGRHNYVLQGACEGIARKLGNALCAPIIKLVPEGNIEEPSGHMRYPGTISLRQETFRMVLDDVASSLKAHGFTDILLIGDSGGNQSGLEATAKALNERWTDATAYYIPEFYDYAAVLAYGEDELGLPETANDGFHDNYYITALMMVTDPTTVRYEQRVAAGKATINGLSIAPKEETIAIGKKLMQFRVDQTVKAINVALSGPTSTRQ